MGHSEVAAGVGSISSKVGRGDYPSLAVQGVSQPREYRFEHSPVQGRQEVVGKVSGSTVWVQGRGRKVSGQGINSAAGGVQGEVQEVCNNHSAHYKNVELVHAMVGTPTVR